jgi:hypothetical protein
MPAGTGLHPSFSEVGWNLPVGKILEKKMDAQSGYARRDRTTVL